MRDTGRHHVIIGDGATAAAFAETAPSEAGDRLSVIGPDIGQLGRGLAYGEVPADRPWADAYLLSAPTRYGSVPSQVQAFIEGMKEIDQTRNLEKWKLLED